MASLRLTGESWELWNELSSSALHGFRRIFGVYLPYYLAAPRSFFFIILFFCNSFVIVDWFALLISELLH